jgi:hypothetical protein
MKKMLRAATTVCLLVGIATGQTPFMGLTPGTSSKADADRLLGQPIKNVSETLLEYRSKEPGQKLYVQYRQEADVIDRIEVIFETAVPRAVLSSVLGLSQKADSTKWDSKGRIEEYFGANKLIVLTHETPEASSPVYRVGYYSSDLFAVALRKPTGTPKQAAAPPPGVAPTGNFAKSAPKSFNDVELLVPKGDKSESKSVRLLFDRRDVIIDADHGEKIYKQFRYNSIVSAEYSHSTSPRWKTAIGAAVLIGVFALPIFFMKSKKHWLTIKTANDFAILQLDKDNYKLILPTFETTTGVEVATVEDKR